MGALLASIGIKDYLYGAAIVALVGGFAYYTHHERAIGANEALEPVAVLAQKVRVQVAAATVAATSTEKDNAKRYAAAVAAPTPAALGIVCQRAPSGSELPKADTGGAAEASEPAPVSRGAITFDPSGAALKLAHDADAQIAYLQGRVHELEAQMDASP